MSSGKSPDTPRVLVVDDERSVLAFVERALRGAGYEVAVSSDGPEALRLVEAAPRPFDVFVVDVVMPLLRGDELGRRLRQQDPDVKVLYFTGFSERLFESRPTLWKHEAFIEKPVTVRGLLEAVSLMLFGHTKGPGVGSPSSAA
jgi:CheY-like chemotaxis protein